MKRLVHDVTHQDLLEQISRTYTTGRAAAFEQGGKDRAEYGIGLIKRLSGDLRLRHGRGFSRSNLIYMHLLYLCYPIGQIPSDLLSWSHYKDEERMHKGRYTLS
jgi:hypothetical protein